MKPNSCEPLIALVIAIVLQASPLIAQRRTPPKKPPTQASPSTRRAEPAPTFDTLLSADNYHIYCEVRSVGQLISSPAFKDLLDPIMKLAGPPKEFRTVLKWLNAHADALAGSRMLVASWPAKPKLPNVVMAIEFASAEEAQKFDPQLRRLMPTLLPTPTPATSPDASGPKIAPPAAPQLPEGSERLPYHIKQAGNLVLISDQPFTFRSLTPRGSKPLAEDQNFALARNRFASESIFLYVDLKSIEKEERELQKKNEEAEQLRIESEAANPIKHEEAPAGMNTSNAQSPVEGPTPPPGVQREGSAAIEVMETTGSNAQLAGTPTLSASSAQGTPPPESEEMNTAMMSLNGLLFGGQPKWPEALGAAVAFEGDSYVVRALILNGAEDKPNAIPFIPQFVSGPPLVPASPNIFPSDTELLVTASLDLPQVYEGTIKAFVNAEELARKYRGGRVGITEAIDNRPPESPFAAYEKKLGIKIKEDLLPLLGNELAVALPAKPTKASPIPTPNAGQTRADNKETNASSADPNPIIAVSVRDSEGVRKLLPKIIESLAFKGANLFAQTEKRDQMEITTYANVLSYAFVGDFLVLSPDPAATRHVVDSYLSNKTLSSDSHFRNFTRWQPRQVLGQVYIAPDLMQRYTSVLATGAPANNKVLEFLNGLNPDIEPVTYVLANEGSGPLHELHIPKNLLLLMIAGMSRQASEIPPAANEAIAKGLLRTVMSAEAMFLVTQGNDRYGTIDELISANLLSKETMQKYGYRIEVAASGSKFEATAVPLEYGQTGRMSYFIDESGVMRGGDHGGGPATISDQPVD
jgi:hypothetical protein